MMFYGYVIKRQAVEGRIIKIRRFDFASAILAICGFCFILFLAAGCSTPKITPMVRVAQLEIDGDLDFKAGGGLLTSSTTASQLGLDDETVIQPRIDLDWEKLHLGVEGFQTHYEGDGTLSNTLNFGGNTIPFNAPVSSDWDLDLYRTFLVYDVLPWDFMDVGIGGGLGYIKYDAKIRSQLTGAWVASDSDLPFAFLTARLNKDIDRFSLQALVSGVSADLEDDDLSYFDAEAQASFLLFSKDNLAGRIMVGYRFVKVVYEWEDNNRDVELDADFKGPFLGFALRF
jgi:hypothetical protein